MPTRVRVVAIESVRPIVKKWTRYYGKEADTLWAEFIAPFLEAKGIPAGMHEDKTTQPSRYTCDFPGGGQAQLVVRTRKAGFITWEVDVIMIDLVFSPESLPD